MSKVYSVITDRVIALLEAGTVPWRRPWDRVTWPRNLASGREYRGVNVFMLSCAGFGSPYWLTFRQAKERGGHVKRGEKGFPVIFWTLYDKEDAETGKPVRLPVLRYFTAFNVEQTEGIEYPREPSEAREFSPIAACEAIASGMPRPPTLAHGGDRAFYRPSTDTVTMPERERFHGEEVYYSTLFHELAHATGHESRLARSGVTDLAPFGTADYSKEELVAEMGAAFLCGHAGIEPATIENSAAYLAGWLRVLRRDARCVVQAAAAAQKAADYILGVTWDE